MGKGGGGRTLPQTVVECDGRPNGASLNRRRRQKSRRRDTGLAETELSSVFHTVVFALITRNPGQASFSPEPGYRDLCANPALAAKTGGVANMKAGTGPRKGCAGGEGPGDV